MITPDQQQRMEQAGAYLREVAHIVMQIYMVLVDETKWKRDADGKAFAMEPHLAASVAENLVVSAMAMGGEWQ